MEAAEVVGKAGEINAADPGHMASETAQEEKVAPLDGQDAPEDTPCELRENRWSVVSFEGVVKSGLDYSEAEKLADAKNKSGTSGVCIITDEAAARIKA